LYWEIFNKEGKEEEKKYEYLTTFQAFIFFFFLFFLKKKNIKRVYSWQQITCNWRVLIYNFFYKKKRRKKRPSGKFCLHALTTL
jgi:hypothetical protein